jgi:hypothetical protein
VHKIALAYQSGNTAFFIDGVQISTTNTATFTNGTLNKISLGTAGDGSGNQLGDRISQALLFPDPPNKRRTRNPNNLII